MDSMKTPRVSAIILDYNLTEYTIECIRSLQAVNYPSLDILVIDNGSKDHPAQRLSRLFPTVQVRSTGDNLGYTGGINAGFKIAMESTPDYILVLNPDTEVDPAFLTHLVKAMEDDLNAAGACGTIYAHHDRTLVWYAGGRMVPWRGLALHDYMNEHRDPSTLGSPVRVSFITGCLILFRASSLAKVGWEDERFFMVLDDIEFSARILRHGYSLIYVPQAVIYHKILGEKESPFKLYYAIRNRLLLINVAFGGFNRLVAKLWFLSALSLKLLVWAFMNRAFYRAARMGIADYFQGRFFRGRGVDVFKYREDS